MIHTNHTHNHTPQHTHHTHALSLLQNNSSFRSLLKNFLFMYCSDVLQGGDGESAQADEQNIGRRGVQGRERGGSTQALAFGPSRSTPQHTHIARVSVMVPAFFFLPHGRTSASNTAAAQAGGWGLLLCAFFFSTTTSTSFFPAPLKDNTTQDAGRCDAAVAAARPPRGERGMGGSDTRHNCQCGALHLVCACPRYVFWGTGEKGVRRPKVLVAAPSSLPFPLPTVLLRGMRPQQHCHRGWLRHRHLRHTHTHAWERRAVLFIQSGWCCVFVYRVRARMSAPSPAIPHTPPHHHDDDLLTAAPRSDDATMQKGWGEVETLSQVCLVLYVGLLVWFCTGWCVCAF